MKAELHTERETRPWKELGGGIRRRIRSYDKTLMAMEVAYDKGGIGAPHTHPHQQLTYCLVGEFRFNVDGEEILISDGDTLIFQEGALHGCVALTDGMLLDVFTPAREDLLASDDLG